MLEFSLFPYELDDAKKSMSFKGANNKSKPSKQNKKEKSSNDTKQSNKLKILCIHGYRQNEKMFREKTGAFRKIVGKYADLVFITAPHFVKPIDEEDPNQVTFLLTQYPVNTIIPGRMCRQIIPLIHIVFSRIRGDGGLVEKMIISKLMMCPIVIKVNNFYLKKENTGIKSNLILPCY